MEGAWIDASIDPPVEEHYFGESTQSIDVLVQTDNGEMWVAYLVTWTYDPGGPCERKWKEKGRDYYTLEGVVAWMYFPERMSLKGGIDHEL